MYRFKFTTLTPLHISNGETLDQNFHYTVFKDELYRIDHTKFSKLIAKKEKVDFTQEITTKTIESWVRKYQLNIIDDASSYSVKIHPTFQAHLDNKRAEGKRQVVEFINSNGNFYIPASSIKGALITSLNKTLFHFTENENGNQKIIDIKQDFLGIKEIKYKNRILKEASISDKFVFSDSNFIDPSKFSVIRFDRPPQQNFICLDTGEIFYLDIIRSGNLDLDLLKKNLSSYARDQVAKAQTFIHKFERDKGGETKGSQYYKEALTNLRKEINNISDKEYLINIGFGGGAYFKIYSDVERIPKNTRKEFIHTSYTSIIEDIRNHIGWCKLEIEELWKLTL